YGSESRAAPVDPVAVAVAHPPAPCPQRSCPLPPVLDALSPSGIGPVEHKEGKGVETDRYCCGPTYRLRPTRLDRRAWRSTASCTSRSMSWAYGTPDAAQTFGYMEIGVNPGMVL